MNVAQAAPDPAAGGLARHLPALTWLRAYEPRWLGPDLVAGLTLAAYAIPAGNMGGGAPERWAFGLRFPLGLSFDACTGDMFVGDSHSSVEEINFAPAKAGGQNYGWSMYAGNECFKPACTATGKTFPTYINDDAFMLHGGFVYRGSKLPSFRGHYFAVDRSNQVAVAFELVNSAPVLRNLSADLGANLVGTQGIGQDSRGELYLANHSGAVYRIDPE